MLCKVRRLRPPPSVSSPPPTDAWHVHLYTLSHLCIISICSILFRLHPLESDDTDCAFHPSLPSPLLSLLPSSPPSCSSASLPPSLLHSPYSLPSPLSPPSPPHSVYDVRHVEVLQSTEQLVQQVGDAVVVQLQANHTRQVGIHCLHHNVSVRGGEGRGGGDGGVGHKTNSTYQ